MSQEKDNGSVDADGRKLQYQIELWTNGEQKKVLAQAAQASLARAIYVAAQTEHPDEVVVLRRDDTVLARSSEENYD